MREGGFFGSVMREAEDFGCESSVRAEEARDGWGFDIAGEEDGPAAGGDAGDEGAVVDGAEAEAGGGVRRPEELDVDVAEGEAVAGAGVACCAC